MKKLLSMILALTFILSLCIVPSATVCKEDNMDSIAAAGAITESEEIVPHGQLMTVSRQGVIEDGDIRITLRMSIDIYEDSNYASGYRIAGLAKSSRIEVTGYSGVKKVGDFATITDFTIDSGKQFAAFTAEVKVQYVNSAQLVTVALDGIVRY